MIKLSTSTAAWQLIWQVNTQGLGKKKIFFFFSIKEGKKTLILKSLKIFLLTSVILAHEQSLGKKFLT